MAREPETIGAFRDLAAHRPGEYLELCFIPDSKPLKQRWRNNGLSADFLGDYVTTFFPRVADDPETVTRQAAIKDGVTYIANEILENAMKNADGEGGFPVSVRLSLEADRIIISGTNVVGTDQATVYRGFIETLRAADPMAL